MAIIVKVNAMRRNTGHCWAPATRGRNAIYNALAAYIYILSRQYGLSRLLQRFGTSVASALSSVPFSRPSSVLQNTPFHAPLRASKAQCMHVTGHMSGTMSH